MCDLEVLDHAGNPQQKVVNNSKFRQLGMA